MRSLSSVIAAAWRLAKPYFARSDERWSARLLLLAIVVLNLSLVGMTVILNFWNRAFYNTLQEKDWQGFFNLLFLWRWDDGLPMPGFCAIAALYILVSVYRTYLNQWLRIRWRQWMTTRLLDEWLSARAYYRIGLEARPGTGTDNPDQRIADDLARFTDDTLALALDLLSNVVTLFSFLAILWGLSGSFTLLGVAIPGYMVWAALVYSAFGSWITHKVGRPLAALNFRQQRVEADFRFALVRMRENAEGIALIGGEAEERGGLVDRFAALAENWWHIMRRTKALNALTAGYNQVAIIFPFVVAAPRYFAGATTLGDLTQTADAFGQVQGAMSWFVNSYASLAAWRATVERLATFQNAVHDAQRAAGPAAADARDYGFAGVTLALPTGTPLLENASLAIPPGQHTMLTGRSGSGKSTAFRAFAGIWPFGAGTVNRAPGRALFLPQRPYIPLGTLRHAACYPDATDAHTDDAVRETLAAVGLGHLAPRLDEEDAWAQRLSGGEQQRLAICRALLVRPDWLFLDEATASLDPAGEQHVYELLLDRLGATTTIVSISHNERLGRFHKVHATLSDRAITTAPLA